jgi:hypothetical protein
MRKLIKTMTWLSLVAVLGLAALLTSAPAAQASGVSQRGCPAEAFCIYPENAYWNNNHPSNIYTGRPDLDKHYWVNLHNQVGVHKVFNNMSCAYVSLNLGYNGASPKLYVFRGESYDWKLTPYNSITVWGTMCG